MATSHQSIAVKRAESDVVVITDRIVLDRQLQDTINQFEHKQGVAQKIDQDSTQLAEALKTATPIIITTLQEFPLSRPDPS
jgi:type I restriction enzyme R subunit